MRITTSFVLTTALTVIVTLGVAAPVALADEWHEHHDMRDYHEHEQDRWHAGHWYHGLHDGRDGWWWTVDGIWYYYPSPVYPYPAPYTPPTVIVEPAPAPSAVVTATTGFMYYCSNPAGYYPNVPDCYAPWQKVATTTVAPAPQPAPIIVQPAPDQHALDAQQVASFGAELQNINLHDKTARTHLRDLSKRVETFHKDLFHRSYNAMELLHQTEELQHRISEKRNQAAHTVSGSTVVIMPSAPATPVSPPQ